MDWGASWDAGGVWAACRRRWRGPSPAGDGSTGPVGLACRGIARAETGPSGIHRKGTTKRLLKRHLAEKGASSSYPR